jgi:uncharacterized protein YbaA (DUF1428 family)
MATYVDGFVLPIPRKRLAEYRALARKSATIWKEHGALEYLEGIADDVAAKGSVTFARAVKLKKGEVVFFSYIVYRSRKHRDSVNKKIMKDPRILAMMDPANNPFDMRRMLYGGFKGFVEL